MPPDVAALDADLAAATSILTEATKVHDAAEAADTQAADKVRAFRPRHELLTLRQQWDDLAKANSDLPALEADVTNAVIAHGEAKQATEAAEQHAEQLRMAAERAADTADRAEQAVTSATDQTATLATITIPHDLAELTTALTALRARHAELARRDRRRRGRLPHCSNRTEVRPLGSHAQHRPAARDNRARRPDR